MHVRKKKAFIPLFCLLILTALFMNWGGDQMVSRWNWPVWIDSAGTMLVAYLLGPWCAAIVGAEAPGAPHRARLHDRGTPRARMPEAHQEVREGILHASSSSSSWS